MKNTRHKQPVRPNLYGSHAVREAWLNPARTIHGLYMSDQAKTGFEKVMLEGKGRGLRRQPPIMVDKKKLDKMLPSGAVHQGLALAASEGEEFSIADLLIKTHEKKAALILMLDQVTDPHNVGAILRSACAFGADGVVMQKKHAPSLDGVLAKTACGAVEHMPVAFVTNLSRALEEFKEGGYFAYGLDERGEKEIGQINAQAPAHRRMVSSASSENPPDITPRPAPSAPAFKKSPPPQAQKIILVLGAEGPGIRYLVKEHCDALVRLPTAGPIASLNVSNAAAVALYALREPQSD